MMKEEAKTKTHNTKKERKKIKIKIKTHMAQGTRHKAYNRAGRKVKVLLLPPSLPPIPPIPPILRFRFRFDKAAWWHNLLGIKG